MLGNSKIRIEVNMVQYLLPIILLGLAFLLKLLIDRSATIPLFLQSVLELPVDIAFLGTSFLVASIISENGSREYGLLCFLLFIIATVLIIFFWRRSVSCYDNNKFILTTLLGTAGYAISIFALIYSIGLLLGGAK